MRWIALCCAISLSLISCSTVDPMDEINQLAASGKIVPAKKQFKELVEAEDNPNLEREYIKFLYEHKQYLDFKNASSSYLSRQPQDTEIQNLNFDFYAKLATDAERAGNYEDALFYIVNKLLKEEYKDFRQWESKTTVVLKKWFNEAEAKEDEPAMIEIMTQMQSLGYENMAKSLDPALFEKMQKANAEAEVEQN